MMLAGIGLFGAGAGEMAYEALTNDRGLILNGIFTFLVHGATIFYWCVAAVCMLFVLVAIFALARSWATPGVLRLTSTELLLPPNVFVRKPIAIRLSGITGINVHTMYKERFIYVYHAGGKASVNQSMLPNSEAFDRLFTALTAKVRGKSR